MYRSGWITLIGQWLTPSACVPVSDFTRKNCVKRNEVAVPNVGEIQFSLGFRFLVVTRAAFRQSANWTATLGGKKEERVRHIEARADL